MRAMFYLQVDQLLEVGGFLRCRNDANLEGDSHTFRLSALKRTAVSWLLSFRVMPQV